EAARRSQCKSQLRQLAIGSMNHHDTHGHFQTGGWGWFWVGDPDRGFSPDQPGGWVYNTLPFIEEGALHDLGSDGDPDKRTIPQRRGAEQVVKSPITIINCPTRRPVRTYPLTTNDGGGNGLFNSITPDVAGRSDYAMNAGAGVNEFPSGQGPADYDLAKTYTWQSQSKNYKPHMNGISYERSDVSIRQITDGTSNTYLLGEKYIPVIHYEDGEWGADNETWCTGFNNDNYRVTGRLVNPATGVIEEMKPVQDSSPDVNGGGRFGSAHQGAWQVAFCDGSVRAMSYEIDWVAHRDLGNRADGNVVDNSGL
ncbi:MAG: DUF1559 domain-containing protein, partial [Planctomycetales bacterium]|nr:DUF1559 domain-containing protein [Planctomycetales bacterium]